MKKNNLLLGIGLSFLSYSFLNNLNTNNNSRKIEYNNKFDKKIKSKMKREIDEVNEKKVTGEINEKKEIKKVDENKKKSKTFFKIIMKDKNGKEYIFYNCFYRIKSKSINSK